MSYSVKELSKISSVSVRTLHWYDKIGLLVPQRGEENGYRIYKKAELDRLQDILFFKELGMELCEIKVVLDENSQKRAEMLKAYKERLLQKKRQINRLLGSVDKTILSLEGNYIMKANEKFEAFKENLIEENEAKYGEEARRLYGEKAVDGSNELIRQMGEERFAKMQRLGEEINELLKTAVANSESASGEKAAEIANKHREWLKFTWEKYSPEAHCGLAEMYVADERFTEYYDNAATKGAAQFLRDAICANIK